MPTQLEETKAVNAEHEAVQVKGDEKRLQALKTLQMLKEDTNARLVQIEKLLSEEE